MRPISLSFVSCRSGRLRFTLNRLPGVVLAAICVFCAGQPRLCAQNSTSAENKIKATFLYNFPQYVEWPTNAFEGASSPFIIGIIGADPFGTFIDELVRGEKTGGHPMTVRRFKSVADISSCHLLYVGAAERESIPAILQQLDHKPVLTVGESSAEFASRGGMISFIPVGKKMRFQVNVIACETAQLKVSSKLLRMADLVPNGMRTE
jgi:hypothetical protein